VRNNVAEELDRSEVVSFKKLLLSNLYTQEALVNLLEKKGIRTFFDNTNEVSTCFGQSRLLSLIFFPMAFSFLYFSS